MESVRRAEVWQYVSFKSANDGIQIVEPGSTSGGTGRLGVTGQWTLPGDSGAVWQPYVLANLWQDWGGRSDLAFAADTTQVPLSEEATRLEFAGGVQYTLAHGASLRKVAINSRSRQAASVATVPRESWVFTSPGEGTNCDTADLLPVMIVARRGDLKEARRLSSAGGPKARGQPVGS